MPKTRSVITVAAILVAAALVGCAVTAPMPAVTSTKDQTLDMTPAKIRFGYVNGIAFPTLIVAETQGFFAKENLSLEKTGFNGSGPVTDAMAVGNLDMGQTSPTPSMLASIKGAQTTMVSGLEYSFVDKTGKSWEAAYLVVRSGEGIDKLSDLKNKKVAITALGGPSDFMLRAKMLASQIDPDKDMTIVPIPLSQMPSALMQKLVDAAFMNADGYELVQTMGKVKVIATQASIMDLDIDVSASVAVNDEFLRKNPDVVVRFLRALLQARQWMAEDIANHDGKTLVDLVGKSMNYSPERAKTLYETRGGYYGKELDRINLLDIPIRVVKRDFEILKLNSVIKPDTPFAYDKIVDLEPLMRAYGTLALAWDENKHQ